MVLLATTNYNRHFKYIMIDNVSKSFLAMGFLLTTTTITRCELIKHTIFFDKLFKQIILAVHISYLALNKNSIIF